VGKLDILKPSFEFSPKLGVRQLPKLTRDKESNVPGLYIVGDLADAPIIKVALNQGYDVAQRIVAEIGVGQGPDDLLDVVVLGAGPAGIGAALALQEAGARYVVIERERPFATIQNFPKAKAIFSEPRQILSKGRFWFEDATKEALIERWGQALDERMLALHQPEELVALKRDKGLFTVETKVGASGRLAETAVGTPETSGEPGARNVYKARRVILAIGRRGAVRRLKVPGEELDKVAYALRDPADHKGRKVLVVGGGDSAVEAAMACAEAGASVTISYRGDDFARAKGKNKERLAALVKSGALRAELGTTPKAIREDAVVLERRGQTFEVENDDVLVFIGTELPVKLLRKLGIAMEGDWNVGRALWVSSFAILTYLVYVIKKGKSFWPFGEGQPLEALPAALQTTLGFRAVDGAFWGTVLYSMLILVFGVLAYRKYASKTQKRRFLWLIGFQWVFLFGIPELIAPLFMERPWKTYSLSVPWPLWTGSFADGPYWGAATHEALGWIAVGVLVSFVAIPLLVRFHGERFCSYLCGCGGLAETLGDRWRHLAPRGKTAQQAELIGRLILLLAIPVTFFLFVDLWQFTKGETFASASAFSQGWYDLMVDFWLASVLGVALYPYLGNRFWCRFFCPLRALMELLAKWFSKLSIKANDKCIGCGECTRYCQMGIDVQRFAQRGQELHNGNSACIQCSVCIDVCPMEVLSIGARDFTLHTDKLGLPR
jgi:NosR/NirI family transcriptional regulator, nitrous oxide reductase regulator